MTKARELSDYTGLQGDLAAKSPVASPSFTGNVGIGTSSPAQLLEIKGGSNTSLRLHSDTESSAVPAIEMMRGTNDTFGTDAYTDWRMKVQGGNLAIESADNGATTSRMQIDYSGNVLIDCTATPSASVHGWMKLAGGGGYVKSAVGGSGGYTHYQFINTNGAVGQIYTSGSSTTYATSSDYRLKENVTPMSGATAQTKLLKPCNFDWIVGGNTNGFLAHELAEVVPEAVTGTKDAMMDEEYEVTPATGDVFTPSIDAYVDADENEVEAVAEVIHSADVEQPETLEEGQQWRETTAQVMGTRSVPDMQGIDQAKLVPLLTATIQELIARIEVLEA